MYKILYLYKNVKNIYLIVLLMVEIVLKKQIVNSIMDFHKKHAKFWLIWMVIYVHIAM